MGGRPSKGTPRDGRLKGGKSSGGIKRPKGKRG